MWGESCLRFLRVLCVKCASVFVLRKFLSLTCDRPTLIKTLIMLSYVHVRMCACEVNSYIFMLTESSLLERYKICYACVLNFFFFFLLLFDRN
jgi:hypothetical protein